MAACFCTGFNLRPCFCRQLLVRLVICVFLLAKAKRCSVFSDSTKQASDDEPVDSDKALKFAAVRPFACFISKLLFGR